MEAMKVVIIGIALVIATGIIMAGVLGQAAINSPVRNANPVQARSGATQDVTLGANGVQYIMTPGVIKAGSTVRMTVDLNTVRGCMKTVVIPELGVRKSVSASDNVIEFTPTKAGTFQITCGMGMGRGTFQVDDGSGNPIPAANPAVAAPSGSSCGAGGGGCGCGG